MYANKNNITVARGSSSLPISAKISCFLLQFCWPFFSQRLCFLYFHNFQLQKFFPYFLPFTNNTAHLMYYISAFLFIRTTKLKISPPKFLMTRDTTQNKSYHRLWELLLLFLFVSIRLFISVAEACYVNLCLSKIWLKK